MTESLTNDNLRIELVTLPFATLDYYHFFDDLKINARYTVHRQSKGTFTPMVFDATSTFAVDLRVEKEVEHVQSLLTKAFKDCWEPYVNQALFMDIDSPFIVEFIKGQNLGFQRKDEMDKIRNKIRDGNVWYSLDDTPPITLQSQRIVSYDVNNRDHGSMLDPLNVLNHVTKKILGTVRIDKLFVVSHEITDGYTEKQL